MLHLGEMACWTCLKMEKVVPPMFIWYDGSFAYWVDRSSFLLPYVALIMLEMEWMFPPLSCALFLYCMHDGLLVLSLYFHKVSKSSFKDECSQGGDNVTPRMLERPDCRKSEVAGATNVHHPQIVGLSTDRRLGSWLATCSSLPGTQEKFN